MFNVAVFGSGKIGEAICGLLSFSGRYSVLLCDINFAQAELIAKKYPKVTAKKLNLQNSDETVSLLKGQQAVLSALPFHCNEAVAQAAQKANAHYLDLTEDVRTTDAVSKIAAQAKTAFMPQCGLAPGFISIAAADLAKKFQKLDTIKMRVGALPIFPSNKLKYAMTWSTAGLINEYCNWCEAIEDGELKMVPPLEGYERLSLDGCEYEAFNTSGGLGSLCETFKGKVRDLNYRTIRHPGHAELIKFLLQDLRFIEDREALGKVFERSIPTTKQDKCIIFVEVSGHKDGHFAQTTYASTVYNREIRGVHFGAIQLTTAAGICAPLDLLLTGKLPQAGIVKAEDISLSDFLSNEFGAYFHDAKASASLSL
jgi:saccharopine dehydrogenase-like NADP-dependent oxidoreductase